MGTISLPYSSFNCGELSPLLEGRTDMPQYQKGGKTMLNFLPTVQGPAVRRGGSRFIGNPVVPNMPGVMIRFSRSQTESYILLFCDQTLRFYFDGGLVVDGFGNPYHINTPYLQSELFNEDGTPAIVAVESADVIFLTHPNHPPQVLSFFAANDWTLAPMANIDGPWQDINGDLTSTIYATGTVTIGSTVTLTASKSIFNTNMVGGLIRLHQQDLTTIKPWQPGQQTPNIATNVLRRSGFCTYKCVSAAYGTIPSGGTTPLFVQTGGVTLIHTSGNAWDGDQTVTIDPIGSATYYGTGVEWSYQDCGYGVVKITGYTSATSVTGIVQRQLPAAVIGSGNATNVWEMGAWSNDQGWPSQVTFYRQRLTFGGGAGTGNRVWMSVVGDYTNFADLDFGEVLPTSAVTLACQADQVNTIVYLSPADTLMVGTFGGEFQIGPQSISDPFGPENAQVALMSAYGGRAVVPTRVQQYTLFITKNGRTLRESTFAFTAGPAGSFVSNDKTVLSEHITNGGIIATAWAKNPYQTIWMVLGNGNLISFIYNPEQEVMNWERHDIGGNGNVVAIVSVPSIAGDWDDVYIEVERVIDTAGDKRYSIERIEQPFLNLPGSRQQDCFYVDCGNTLYNAIGATLQPGTGANVTGSPNVAFVAGNTILGIGPFTAAMVGQYIHFDFMTTTVGDDGLTYPLATKAVAYITHYVNANQVTANINVAFPNLSLIASGNWRLTVSQFAGQAEWTGQTISLLGDGAAMPDQPYPVSGLVKLAFPVSVLQAGLKSPAVFTTMKMEGGDRTGTAQGKIKRIVRASVRVKDSLGLEIGRDIENLEEVSLRPYAQPDDTAPPLVSGEYPDADRGRLTFDGEWDRVGRLTIRAEQPLPLTLVSLSIMADVEEDS